MCGDRSVKAIPIPTLAGDNTRWWATRPRSRSEPRGSATSHTMGDPTGQGSGVCASTRIPVDDRLTARATTLCTWPGQITRTSRRKPTRGSVLLPNQPTMVLPPHSRSAFGEGKRAVSKLERRFANVKDSAFQGAEERRPRYNDGQRLPVRWNSADTYDARPGSGPAFTNATPAVSNPRERLPPNALCDHRRSSSVRSRRRDVVWRRGRSIRAERCERAVRRRRRSNRGGRTDLGCALRRERRGSGLGSRRRPLHASLAHRARVSDDRDSLRGDGDAAGWADVGAGPCVHALPATQRWKVLPLQQPRFDARHLVPVGLDLEARQRRDHPLSRRSRRALAG